jgi:hypothetical protein
MPTARYLIIMNDDEGVFLYRLDQHGGVAGDTWHATMDDAHEQAIAEYGPATLDWHPIPQDSAGLLEAVKYLREVVM